MKAGDLIMQFDGRDIREITDLTTAVQSSPGKAVDVVVLRDQRPLHLRITIARLPTQSEWVETAVTAGGGCGQAPMSFGHAIDSAYSDTRTSFIEDPKLYGRPLREWTDQDIATALTLAQGCLNAQKGGAFMQCVRATPASIASCRETAAATKLFNLGVEGVETALHGAISNVRARVTVQRDEREAKVRVEEQRADAARERERVAMLSRGKQGSRYPA